MVYCSQIDSAHGWTTYLAPDRRRERLLSPPSTVGDFSPLLGLLLRPLLDLVGPELATFSLIMIYFPWNHFTRSTRASLLHTGISSIFCAQIQSMSAHEYPCSHQLMSRLANTSRQKLTLRRTPCTELRFYLSARVISRVMSGNVDMSLGKW